MIPKLVDWLLGNIGKKLVSVFALVYLVDGEKDFYNPQELDIQFSLDEHVKIKCSRDGSSIELRYEELHESDMGDFGCQIIENLSNYSLWKTVIDKKLIDASLIYSSVEEAFIGVRFFFEGGEKISILNLGDELYIYQEIPEMVVCDQCITYFSVFDWNQ